MDGCTAAHRTETPSVNVTRQCLGWRICIWSNPEITYIYLKKLNKFNKYILYQIISFLPNIKDIKDEINYEKKIRKDIQIEISDWFSNYNVFEPDDEDYYHEDYNEDYYHEDY